MCLYDILISFFFFSSYADIYQTNSTYLLTLLFFNPSFQGTRRSSPYCYPNTIID